MVNHHLSVNSHKSTAKSSSHHTSKHSKDNKSSSVGSGAGGSANTEDLDYLGVSGNTAAGYEHTSELLLSHTNSLPQYAILKYGDNSELIFNINCKVK